MDPILVSILAGLIPSIFTGLITYFATTSTTSIKVRNELLQTFSIKLYEQRIERYRELYKILSDLIKDIDFREKFKDLDAEGIKGQIRKEFLLKLEDWDSNYAVFMSQSSLLKEPISLEKSNKSVTTVGIIYGLRRFIYETFLKENDVDKLRFYLTGKEMDGNETLMKQILLLEVALKKEIGVYDIPPYPTYKGFSQLSFSEANEEIILLYQSQKRFESKDE